MAKGVAISTTSGNGTLFQQKFLPGNIGTTADIATLRFSNLEIGKTYKVTMQHIWLSAIVLGLPTSRLTANHNGVVVARTGDVYANSNASGTTSSVGDTGGMVFVATATTLTFDYSGSSTSLQGDGTSNLSFVQLEELPTHTATTKWT